jgi:hypothetical protein
MRLFSLSFSGLSSAYIFHEYDFEENSEEEEWAAD